MSSQPQNQPVERASVPLLIHPPWRRFLPVLLITLSGIALTWLITQRFLTIERNHLQSEFDRQSHELVLAVASSVKDNLETLDAIASFFSASDNFDQRAFRKFVTYLLRDHPSIYSLEWIPLVTEDQRPLFETRVRAEGNPSFRIVELDEKMNSIPVRLREEYFPACYVEPLEQNRNILGLDHASDPEKKWAMDQSRDQGYAVATKVLRLSHFKNRTSYQQYGAMVFMPVYDLQDPHPDSVKERRRKLRGFVAATFHVESMINLALQDRNTAALQLQIFARTVESHRDLIDIYFPKSPPRTNSKLHQKHWAYYKPFRNIETIRLAEQPWRFISTSTPAFWKQYQRWQPVAAFAIGFLLTLLFAAYLLLQEERHRQALTYALSLTDELTQLYNRRGFLALAEERLKLARRTKRGLLFIMADLDYLKKINDTYGHAEGDWALAQTGAFLKSFFRNSDLVGRLGGDEFAAVLIEATLESKERVLSSFQKNLHAFNEKLGARYTISLSLGAVYFDPESNLSLTEILDLADGDLYDNKQSRTVPKNITPASPKKKGHK